VKQYVRHEPDAVTLVDELLAQAGTSMDVVVVDILAPNLDDIERIDRLTTVAEGRRDASLREIDRRRVVLGETLRRTVQEVEEGEFEVIEATPAKGKKVA
jgi:mannitol-1-phosphate/altronate dehydrogenase